MTTGRIKAVCSGIILVIAVLLTGCDAQKSENVTPGAMKPGGKAYTRIVSLAPNITETLFALGLGDRVVGVSTFCDYPPEALEKQSVGGYLDPNYEMIASLKPDLVLLLTEHDTVRNYLDQLGIHHETVGNRTISEIMDSIDTIGRICGVASRADSLAGDIRMRMAAVRDNVPDGAPPRVLVSIGRTMGTGTLSDIYVAGPGTFYDELITLAGGVNVYSGGNIAYPLISTEGLLHLDPDIIVDLVPDFDEKGYDRAAILAEWQGVGNLKAVQDSAVHILTGDYTVIPGPRFILFLEDIAAIIQAHGAVK